jgi:hypothetical protein
VVYWAVKVRTFLSARSRRAALLRRPIRGTGWPTEAADFAARGSPLGRLRRVSLREGVLRLVAAARTDLDIGLGIGAEPAHDPRAPALDLPKAGGQLERPLRWRPLGW